MEVIFKPDDAFLQLYTCDPQRQKGSNTLNVVEKRIGKERVKRERRGNFLFLTDSDCCNYRRHDHRQRHPASNYQVPLVFRDVLALIAVMDLKREIVFNYL